MPYLVLGDFKGGLDTSRRPIAGGDGILSECVNCHITRGGELERRKSMASFASLPAGTKGLHGLNGALTVFGAPTVVYSDTFSTDTAGEWVRGLNSVDGTFAVVGGDLVYTKGANDPDLPRIVRTIPTEAGARYRLEAPAPTGTANFKQVYISSVADGNDNGALTPFVSNVAANAEFVAPGAAVYLVLRENGIGTDPGRTAALASATVTKLSPAMPAGVVHMPLQHPTNTALTVSEILDTESFDGKIYAIAKFSDGSVHHYFDGALVADWDVLSQPVLTTGNAVDYLAELIDRNSILSASSTATTAVIEGPSDNANFEVLLTRARNGVPVPITDEPVWSVALTRAYAPQESPWIDAPTAEAKAQATITIVRRHSSSSNYRFTAVTIAREGDADIAGLTGNINFSSGESPSQYATKLADALTLTLEPLGFAVSAIDNKVIIDAPEGEAAGGNEYVLTTSSSGISHTIVDFAGGADAFAGNPAPPPVGSQWTITTDGTSAMPDGEVWTVNAGGAVFSVGRRDSPSASILKAHRSKMHAATDSVIHFSGINEPASFLSGIGWGFFNLSNQESGSQKVTAIGNYQGRLAFFTREYVQIWNIDEDEALNTPLQTLRGVGTRSPYSVIEYGGIDTFFVHSSGIRSLRQRQGFDSAAVEDIGTPIDGLVVTSLRALTDDQVRKIKAALEPETDRLWFSIGSKVFVYSFFPSRKIRAWSTYDFGFTLDEIVTTNGRLYARAGDTVYLYGGASGVVYPAADEADALVRTPFLEMGKPGHLKQELNLDVAVWGEWEIDMLFDPEDLDDRTAMGTFDGPTFGRGTLPAAGQSTHVALEFRCSAAGEAGISLAKIGYMAEEP